MREAEGARLAVYLDERLAIVEAALTRIAARAPERVVEQRDRLRATVQELAGGVALDEQRLAQEIAILADRLDVSEEIVAVPRRTWRRSATRFAARAVTGWASGSAFCCRRCCARRTRPAARRTTRRCCSDVVLIKEELERIREQVENLE